MNNVFMHNITPFNDKYILITKFEFEKTIND